MKPIPSQVIVDILTTEMGMPKNSVWVRNQNVKIPDDNGLYIIAGMVAAFPISNVTYMITGDKANFTDYDQPTQNWDVAQKYWDDQEIQVNEVVQNENIQIDILSRSNVILARNWEIIAAMQSFYAQQQQELYNFKIFRIPRNFIDTSAAEGGSQLNRYTITISVQALYQKVKILNSVLGDYYNQFSMRVDTENTIGNAALLTYDQANQTWDKAGQNYDNPGPLIEFAIDSEGIEP